jgi:hypothetical protein
VINKNKSKFNQEESSNFIEEVKSKIEYYTHYFENESVQTHRIPESNLNKSLFGNMNINLDSSFNLN